MCLSEYSKAESIKSVKAEANVSWNLSQFVVNKRLFSLGRGAALLFLIPVLSWALFKAKSWRTLTEGYLLTYFATAYLWLIFQYINLDLYKMTWICSLLQICLAPKLSERLPYFILLIDYCKFCIWWPCSGLLEIHLFSMGTFEDLSRCSAGNSVYGETSKWTG